MGFKHLSCHQLSDQLSQNQPVTLIDIRDPQSYAQGHITGAIHIDNSSVEDFVKVTNRSVPLVVYCYHGNSSQGAADYFAQQGFEETYSLDGGYELWNSQFSDQ